MSDATSKQIPSEIRFTSKGKNVYAFISRWTQSQVLIKSIAAGKMDIVDFTLLDSDAKLKWRQSDEGVMIDLPSDGGTKENPTMSESRRAPPPAR